MCVKEQKFILKHSVKPKLNGHTRRKAPADKGVPEVWSFFSGAMGLDLGLEMAGIHPTLAVEIDSWCCTTIRRNRPSLTLVEGDVTKKAALTFESCVSFQVTLN